MIDADAQGSLTASLGFTEPDKLEVTLANAGRAVLKNVMYAATSCSTGLSPVTWKSMKISALIHPLMDSMAALSVGVPALDIDRVMLYIGSSSLNERDQKGRQDTGQEVEIYFNFVGKYIPPTLKEAEPTPEELEALRQKEERREKLHRAYLQRKASGAQKRYEDKIKARKKAEMDAKKDAIRAEDMAKGIYTPLGKLPRQEPQKAVQTRPSL